MGEPELRLLVLILAGVTAILVVAYHRLRLRINDVVQEQLAIWRERELEGTRKQLGTPRWPRPARISSAGTSKAGV